MCEEFIIKYFPMPLLFRTTLRFKLKIKTNNYSWVNDCFYIDVHNLLPLHGLALCILSIHKSTKIFSHWVSVSSILNSLLPHMSFMHFFHLKTWILFSINLFSSRRYWYHIYLFIYSLIWLRESKLKKINWTLIRSWTEFLNYKNIKTGDKAQ